MDTAPHISYQKGENKAYFLRRSSKTQRGNREAALRPKFKKLVQCKANRIELVRYTYKRIKK